MSTAVLAPPRWPVNTEVIDSPACAMPQYAGYRHEFYLVSGAHVACADATLDGLLDKAHRWAQESSRIVRVPTIPYYDHPDSKSKFARAVGTAPWAGGTWIGLCGATVWVPDLDRSYQRAFATLRALDRSKRYVQDGPLHGYNVGTLQAWWINGIAARYPSLDGFPVECQQPYKGHPDRCRALDIEWDWRDYAPWTDQGHNTQLSLF